MRGVIVGFEKSFSETEKLFLEVMQKDICRHSFLTCSYGTHLFLSCVLNPVSYRLAPGTHLFSEQQ